ncbi:hypothetical protein BGW42_004284 [Actinomortierella wolfii]|nr:hypothetical protein BGW42_004284 [Actinomortierella wolfii]
MSSTVVIDPVARAPTTPITASVADNAPSTHPRSPMATYIPSPTITPETSATMSKKSLVPTDTIATVTPGTVCAASLHSQAMVCPSLDQYTPSLKLAEEINEINQLKTLQTGAQFSASMPPTSSSVSRSFISAGISTLLAQKAAASKDTMSSVSSSQRQSDQQVTTTSVSSAAGTVSTESATVADTTDIHASTAGKTQHKELNWVNAVPSHFDASTTNPRKRRRRTNHAELKVLEDAFARNLLPDAATRQELGQKLGMSVRAVQIWFQNRRQSLRKKSVSMQNLHSHPLNNRQLYQALSASSSLTPTISENAAEVHVRSPGLLLDLNHFKDGSGEEGAVLESGPNSSSSDSSMLMSPPMPSWQRPSSVDDDEDSDSMSIMGRAKSCSDLLLSSRTSKLLRSDTVSSVPSLTSSLSTLSSASEGSLTASPATLQTTTHSTSGDVESVVSTTTTTNSDNSTTKSTAPVNSTVDEPTTPSLTLPESMGSIAEESVEESVLSETTPLVTPRCEDRAESANAQEQQQQRKQLVATSIDQPETESIGSLVDEKLAQHHLNVLLQEAKKDPATSSLAASATAALPSKPHQPQAPVLACWDASAESKPVLNAFGNPTSVSVPVFAGSTNNNRTPSFRKIAMKPSSSSSLTSQACPKTTSDSIVSSASSLAGATAESTLAKLTDSTADKNSSHVLNAGSNNNGSNSNGPRRYNYIKSRPKSLMEMVIHRQREQQREQQLQRQMQLALENHEPSFSTSEWPQRLPRTKKKSNNASNSSSHPNQGGKAGTSSSGSFGSGISGSIASSNFRQSAVLANKQGRMTSTLAYPEYPAEFYPLKKKTPASSFKSILPEHMASLTSMASPSSTLSRSSVYRDQERARALEAEEMATTVRLKSTGSNSTAISALQQLLRGQSTSQLQDSSCHRPSSGSNSESDDYPPSHRTSSTSPTVQPLQSPPVVQGVSVMGSPPPVSIQPRKFLSTPSLDTVCSWSQLKRVQSDSVLLPSNLLKKGGEANAHMVTGQRAQRARRLEIGRDLFQSDSDATVDQTDEEDDDDDEDNGMRERVPSHSQKLAHRFPSAALSKLTSSGRSMTMQCLPTTTRTKSTSLKRGRKSTNSRSIHHLQHHQDHRYLDAGEEQCDEIERQRSFSGNQDQHYQSYPEDGHHYENRSHIHEDEDDEHNDEEESDNEEHPVRRQRLSSFDISQRRCRRVSTSTSGSSSASSGHSRQSSSGGGTSQPTHGITTGTNLPPVGYFSPPRATTAWNHSSPPSPPPSQPLDNLDDEDGKNYLHQYQAATAHRPTTTPLSPTTPSPTRRHQKYSYYPDQTYHYTAPSHPYVSQQHHRTPSLDPLSAMADMALVEQAHDKHDTKEVLHPQETSASSVEAPSSTLNKDELECASVLAGLGWCR